MTRRDRRACPTGPLAVRFDRSRASPTPTTTSPCSTTSTSTSRRAASSGSSDAPAAARARWPARPAAGRPDRRRGRGRRDVDLRVADPALRERVAIVTQDVQLFRHSVRDNLTLFGTVPVSDASSRGAGARPRRLARGPADGPGHRLGPGGPGCPPDRRSCSAWAGPSCATPDSSCSTRPPSRVDPATAERLVEAAPTGCWPGAPASSSPTGSVRCCAPTPSSCSTTAGSSSTVPGRARGRPGSSRLGRCCSWSAEVSSEPVHAPCQEGHPGMNRDVWRLGASCAATGRWRYLACAWCGDWWSAPGRWPGCPAAVFDAIAGDTPAGLNVPTLVVPAPRGRATRVGLLFAHVAAVGPLVGQRRRRSCASTCCEPSSPAAGPRGGPTGRGRRRGDDAFRDDVDDFVIWFVDTWLDLAGTRCSRRRARGHGAHRPVSSRSPSSCRWWPCSPQPRARERHPPDPPRRPRGDRGGSPASSGSCSRPCWRSRSPARRPRSSPARADLNAASQPHGAARPPAHRQPGGAERLHGGRQHRLVLLLVAASMRGGSFTVGDLALFASYLGWLAGAAAVGGVPARPAPPRPGRRSRMGALLPAR
jgi:hypothetical protein